MLESSFAQPVPFQHLEQERDLVTYPRLWLAASNTGDFAPATVAPVPRSRSHESSPRWWPSPASPAGSPPCWLCGSPASNKTSDASGCQDGDGRTPCSANRDEEEIWPRAFSMTAARLPGNSEQQKNNGGEENRSEEDNKSFSVNGGEENGPKKTDYFYTATFKPLSRRPWHL